MRIALDAMGGDFAPGPIVAGAVEAVLDQEDLVTVLVGDQEKIQAELAKAPQAPLDRLPIVHAAESIGMDEKPVEALRKKRDNSISRSWGLMAAGEVQAVVSAGNTGAMVASALFAGERAKMFLPGVRRPGIAAMPGRRTPGRNILARSPANSAAATIAPVFPAETIACTSPVAIRPQRLEMELSRFLRRASTGFSSMPIDSAAWTIGRRSSGAPGALASSASIFSRSPTRTVIRSS